MLSLSMLQKAFHIIWNRIQPWLFPALLNRVVFFDLSSILLGTGRFPGGDLGKLVISLQLLLLSPFLLCAPFHNEKQFAWQNPLTVNYNFALISIVEVLYISENIFWTLDAFFRRNDSPTWKICTEILGGIFWCPWHCTMSAATLIYQTDSSADGWLLGALPCYTQSLVS